MKKTAFTLVELLVVIAIIALLVSILLPSLAKAREEAKKVKCLANLREIGSSSAAYANSDTSGYYVPVLPTLYRPVHVSASRRAFGGKSGMHDFEGQGFEFPNQATWYGGNYGMWSTKNGFGPFKRPLNRYIYKNLGPERSYAEIEALDIDTALAEEQLEFAAFRCPSDVGYEAGKDGNYEIIFGYGGLGGSDATRTFSDRMSTYDAMGSSYSTDALLSGGAPGGGSIAWGIYFRPYSQVPAPSRVTAYLETKGFYSAFWNNRQFPETSESYAWGNHGINREHMVGFADGHAGPVLYEVRDNFVGVSGGEIVYGNVFTLRGGTTSGFTFNPGLLEGTDVDDWDHLLLNGPDWQNHCQPNPPVMSGSVTWTGE